MFRAFCVLLKNLCLPQGYEIFFPYVSFQKNYNLSSYRCYIHIKLILVCIQCIERDRGQGLIFFHMSIQVFKHHLLIFLLPIKLHCYRCYQLTIFGVTFGLYSVTVACQCFFGGVGAVGVDIICLLLYIYERS